MTEITVKKHLSQIPFYSISIRTRYDDEQEIEVIGITDIDEFIFKLNQLKSNEIKEFTIQEPL